MPPPRKKAIRKKAVRRKRQLAIQTPQIMDCAGARQHAYSYARDVVDTFIKLALGDKDTIKSFHGCPKMLTTVFRSLVPAASTRDDPIRIPGQPGDSPADRLRAVFQHLADGLISLEQASTFVSLLQNVIMLSDYPLLQQKVRDLQVLVEEERMLHSPTDYPASPRGAN